MQNILNLCALNEILGITSHQVKMNTFCFASTSTMNPKKCSRSSHCVVCTTQCKHIEAW